MIGGRLLFPSNMQPRLFSKRQLTATALMLDEEEQNAGLHNTQKRMWVHKFKNTTTWSQIANDFWDLWDFPNFTGAIDGKHVKVQAPPNSGSKFFNYKHGFFVVLLAMVDARYKFAVVDIGSYGRKCDGGIFAHSKFGNYVEAHLGIPENKRLSGT
jgi:hypothetical protein